MPARASKNKNKNSTPLPEGPREEYLENYSRLSHSPLLDQVKTESYAGYRIYPEVEYELRPHPTVPGEMVPWRTGWIVWICDGNAKRLAGVRTVEEWEAIKEMYATEGDEWIAA